MIAAAPVAWYVARSGGLVAWLMCAASMAWGLTLSTRLVRRRGLPAWLLDLHRYLGMLAIVFTLVHLVGLWLDDYVAFGARELLVPFASRWRPAAVAWGVVAFYLLVAVQISSLAMRHLPRRIWRQVHRMSFALFVLATVHGLAAGTDRSNVVVGWTALITCMLVVFLVGVRLLSPRSAPTHHPASRS